MDCQGKNSLKIVLLLCAVVYGNVSFAKQNGQPDDPYCSVSKEYLDKQYPEKSGELNTHHYLLDRDFSCLTDLASLRDNLHSYQTIDVRTGLTPADRISGAWRMTTRELLSNRALKDQPLLLLGRSFSRIQAASDCASLKQAGFSSVKILVGGAPTWLADNQKRYQNVFGAAKTVSVRDFIYEYLNGNVVVVAESEQLAHDMKLLGLGENSHVISEKGLSLEEIIADKSGGGYYPVVYVGSVSSVPLKHPERVNNLYFLEGSTASVARELTKNQWINANRVSIPRRYRCG